MAEDNVTSQFSEENLSPAAIVSDMLSRVLMPGSGFWLAVIILGLIFVVGLVAFVVRLVSVGLGDRASWAYLATTLAYLLAAVQAAPVLATALYFFKADWRRSITRVSRLFAAGGVMTLLLYIPLVLTLPPAEGRHTIWFDWPDSPWLYDTVAIVVLVLLGLAILYISAIPDFALIRDRNPERHGNLYSRLAFNWQGTHRQWTIHRGSLALLGIFYLMALIFIYMLVASDFAMGLVPEWVSSVFPAFYSVSALQSAMALNIVAFFLWRQFGGLERYIVVDHFRLASKLLFVLSLLFFYMWWSGFIIWWYGRTPTELSLLTLLEFGPYFAVWVLAFVLAFVVPFVTLIWSDVRNSILGPTLVAVSVLIGSFLDKVRLYANAFSFGEAASLESIPPPRTPDVFDILMIVGTFAGVGLLYLATAKLMPPVAIWEVKEGLRLRVRRPFLRGKYLVLGKPH